MSESQLIEKRKMIEEEFKKLQESRQNGLEQLKKLQTQISSIDKRAAELTGSYATLTELIGDDPSKKNSPKEKKAELKPEEKEKEPQGEPVGTPKKEPQGDPQSDLVKRNQ